MARILLDLIMKSLRVFPGAGRIVGTAACCGLAGCLLVMALAFGVMRDTSVRFFIVLAVLCAFALVTIIGCGLVLLLYSRTVARTSAHAKKNRFA